MDERMKTHGDFGWRELMTDDVDTAREFYETVIGWNAEVVDVGKGPYTLLKIGDRPVAGMMAKPAMAAEAPTAWTCYVTVDDVDARAARAADAGGTVIVPPMDIPTVGRMAIVRDPTGGSVGIISYADPVEE